MSSNDKIFKNDSPWGSPPGPGLLDPHGDSSFNINISSLDDITLYIVTFEIKTSYDKAI